MKLLLPLIEPLGIAWLLLTAFVVRRLIQVQYRTLLLPACSWCILTVFTCTSLPSVLLASLEGTYPPVIAGEIPACDAIVCLGGGVSPSPPEPSGIHLKNAADRLAAALVLTRLKKAPHLVLGGGGYKIHGKWRSEADTLKEQLGPSLDLQAEIISLGLCADTHDEALRTASLAETHHWRTILLVTSAYHMPRAVAVFERQGMKVVPVPCNYITSKFRGTERTLLHPPNHGELESFRLWMHEVIGSLYYRCKGWI
jgi:uncharacterized SAM-binding protein YcdF (DUF218 family)